jgi:polyisoprenoid-binding protein YceI
MKTYVKVLIAAAVLLVGAVAAGVWWFFRDDAPARVNLATAVESVTTTSAAAPTATTAPTAGSTTAPAAASTTTASSGATTDGVAGTWVVDTESGTFDYESATGSFAGFRIEEELASIGSTTAVGRTGDVTGSITIDGTILTAADFEVDVSTITTNDNRRDDRVQSALQTSTHPTATFTLVEPADLGADAANGQPISVTAVGDLTIKGVTRRVSFPLEAQVVNDTVVVVGSLDITFSDYGVEVPDSQIVLSVEDHGILELQFLLTRSAE